MSQSRDVLSNATSRRRALQALAGSASPRRR
jgi:hypothetical protein